MGSVIVKHIRLIPAYVRLVLKEEIEYKFAMYLYLLSHVVSVLVWIIFWRAMLNNIGTFGEWSFPLMVLLTGFVTISQGFMWVFLGIYQLPAHILNGKLNTYLVKPVHPFLHLISKEINVHSAVRVALGVVLVVVPLFVYTIPYSTTQLMIALAMSILGFAVTTIPFALVCCLSFWIGRGDFVRDLFAEIFPFQQYPLSEFPTAFVYAFTFVLPLIFSGTFPVLVLTVLTLQESVALLGVLLCLTIGQLAVFSMLWKAGLRRYESYGG